MIKAVNICHSFKGNRLFNNANISFDKELNIISGRSGSGKTTLMNILSGLLKAESGNIFIDETDITKLSEKELTLFRRKNMGFVFQSVALLSQFTAYENVAFINRLVNKTEESEEILSLFSQFGLQGKENKKPFELSGGEAQRVAIIRAIINKPKILFADEPTAQLDSVSSILIAKLFKELQKKENITIVMTTHDPLLLSYADKIYEMEAII